MYQNCIKTDLFVAEIVQMESVSAEEKTKSGPSTVRILSHLKATFPQLLASSLINCRTESKGNKGNSTNEKKK